MIMDKHKGTASELIALIWLLKEGYEVYRNVSPYGCCDLMAMKPNELLKIDVKTGTSLRRGGPTKEQRLNGVKLLIVDLLKNSVLGWAEEIEEAESNCAFCGKLIIYKYGNRRWKFCSKECSKEHQRTVYMPIYNTEKSELNA